MQNESGPVGERDSLVTASFSPQEYAWVVSTLGSVSNRPRGRNRKDAMSAKLIVRQADQVTVVDVNGRITLGDGARLMRDKIAELLKAGKSQILLNLGEVSYIDSSGIGELVAAFTSVTNRDGQLKLLNLTKNVEGLLQITKLYTVFEVFDSEVTAIRSFGSSSAAGSP